MINKIFVFKSQQNCIKEQLYSFVVSTAKSILNTEDEIKISRSESGKPFLKDYPDLHFNISHSKDFGAAVFSDSPIGLDIEKLRTIDLKIAERYFSQDERQLVKDIKTFFYVWTRKEALLKQSGEGIRKKLSSFSVLENNKIKTFTKKDFVLSVCSEKQTDFELILEENFQWQP